jgi:citrate synthase
VAKRSKKSEKGASRGANKAAPRTPRGTAKSVAAPAPPSNPPSQKAPGVGKTTRISGYTADRITIRGKDLVTDLMGKVTFSEMMLLHLTGSAPSRKQVTILDAVLVTIMEHGLVPSAIVTRLTHYGAPESVQGAIAAGLLGVGDRFAGTASECAAVLEPIAQAPADERAAVAATTVKAYRERRRPIPGFGHSVHKEVDPRSSRLVQIVSDAGAKGDFVAALAALEHAVQETIGKNLVTNVSAAIAVALGEAGVPAKAVRGIVLTARCAGLAGHVFEEMQSPVGPAIWTTVTDTVKYEP